MHSSRFKDRGPAFGKKHLRLVTAKYQVLVNFEQTLEEAEIEDGECLTGPSLEP